MIVLHVAPGIRPGGGPAGYCYNLMQGWSAGEGPSLDIQFRFHGSRGDRTTSATSGRRFRWKAQVKMWLEYLGLKELLQRMATSATSRSGGLINEISGADVVVFHGPTYLSALQFCKRRDKKVVYMPHSPSVSADEHKMILGSNGIALLPSVYRRRLAEERAFFDAADMVVFPSPGASEQYRQRFAIPNAVVRYIPSGVTAPRPMPRTPPTGDTNRTIVALFAGRYVDHKGYDLFCEASNLRDYNNIQFVTAGSGPLERNYPRVTNLGWRSDIFSVISESDVVVIPNRIAYYDLFPLECAALGKPVILTDVGGSKDQAKLLPDCLVAAADDAQALADKIEAAALLVRSNPHWGAANRLAYEKHMTDHLMVKRWVEAIASLA